MKKRILQILVTVCLLVTGIVLHDRIKGMTDLNGHKTVICIPVFGQSYALGEEANRITDFDSLRLKYDGRIVNEKMDYIFGYFDHSSRFKQYIKRLLHYDRKAFELSVYGMAEALVPQLGEDTIICIFPGGHQAPAPAVPTAPTSSPSAPCEQPPAFRRDCRRPSSASRPRPAGTAPSAPSPV